MISEWFIVAFSAIVAGATVVYAFLTYKLVSETRRLREVQTEPVISIRAEFSARLADGGLELVIRNEGYGGARNISFEFEGDPTYFVGSGMSVPVDELTALKDGLLYLGPHQRFEILMGWLYDDAYHRAIAKPWTIHVSCENELGKSRRSTYIVDFAQFDKLLLRDSTPLFRIERHLAKIEKHLK